MAFRQRDPDDGSEKCPSCGGWRPWSDFFDSAGQPLRTCATFCRNPNRYKRPAANVQKPDIQQAPPATDTAPEERPADRALHAAREREATARLRAEHRDLVEQLREANARAAAFERLSTPYTPSVKARERLSGLREGALVVVGSDWHVEETVDAEKVIGLNSFNLAIARERIGRFFSGVRWLLDYHRQAFVIRDLVLAMNGDLITGGIHPELAETNQLKALDATLWLRRELSDGFATLLEDGLLERLIIPWTDGNHERLTAKPQFKTRSEHSLGWLLGNVLREDWTRDERVDVVIDRSTHRYVEAFGKTLHFTHGDEVKYQGGVGGIGIPLLKRVPMWDQLRPADIHHVGHFHQLRDFGRVVVNGSLIGVTEYSIGIGAGYEVPQQLSYVLDANRGRCMTTPIWLEDRADEEEAA